MPVIHDVFKNKKVLGLIPARGGSKRLPRKNLRQINGKPLIYWSIVEPQESEYIDSVVVSTEDIEIKQYSYNQGIDCVIDRPPSLAQDESRSIDVVLHAVDVLAQQGKKYEYTHYDAVFGMPVQSYVIKYKGKQLGLEFRKSGDLGSVLEKIYQSFSLTEII